MRIAIVGSRDYPNLLEVREFVQSLPRDTVIVTGGARGVDETAEDEARALGMKVVVHRAEWDVYGKAAGQIRNRTIVEDCDKLKAFWNGASTGTKGSITLASKAGKLLGVRQIGKDTRQPGLFDNL